MKFTAQTLLATGLAALSAVAVAEEASPITGNVAFTSDYMFRGISQTDSGPAIQGGLNFAHDSGFHANLWGSNVNFVDGDEASIEIDYTLGFGRTSGAIGWDVSLAYYTYPGAASVLDYDYYELILTGSYDFGPAKLSGGIWHSPDFFGGEDKATYFMVGVDVPLPANLALNAHLGRQNLDLGKDYMEWKVGVAATVMGLGMELAYWDTDLKKAECGNTDWCEGRAVFTVSKSF